MIEDKLTKLEDLRKKLKTKFFGIDQQIDMLINYMTPWYCVPDLQDRPVVIFLAGMTGNGKTSLIRTVLAELDVPRQVYFDCGEESSSSYRLSQTIEELFSKNEEIFSDSNPFESESNNDARNIAFVFDEFQYCRNIDESGKEINKGNIRVIWDLIDSGILSFNSNNYKTKDLTQMAESICELANQYPDCQLNRLFIDESSRGQLQDDITWCAIREIEYATINDDDYWRILSSRNMSFLRNSLNRFKKGYGNEVINKLLSSTKLSDVIEPLEEVVKIINRASILNCSKSIVFILGNIDEAYGMCSDLNPDMDADMFHEMTKNINVLTIKDSLKKRFRIEQISRLGNNIIAYPSLTSDSFKKIIDSELNRLSKRSQKLMGVDIKFSDNIRKLIFKEGVIPAQGARPILFTISSIISPRISEIGVNLELNKDFKEVLIDTASDDFDSDSIDLVINYLGTGRQEIYTQSLILGALRNTNKSKYINIIAIHEAGHAVVNACLFGEEPNMITALSANGGGFMENNKSSIKDGHIRMSDVENRVCVLLAGNLSEIEFFNEATLGSSSDLSSAWGAIKNAVYQEGMLYPIKLTDNNRNGSVDDGFGDRFGNFNAEAALYEKYNSLVTKTKELIKSERLLILEIAKYLSLNRTMNSEVFLEYIDKYGNQVSRDNMKRTNKLLYNFELPSK